MHSPPRFASILQVLLLIGLRLAAAEPATPNDQARFLAGLPVRGTSLEPASLGHAWAEHAVAFDQAWTALERRQLSPIRTWMQQIFPTDYADRGPVFYMFSGPDFLYAHAFFPDAATYVLCGIEPIGALPDAAHFDRESIGPSLRMLRQSLDSSLNFSFFITKNMRVELEKNHFAGTLPILYVFLARAGCQIGDVNFVWLNKAGTLVTEPTSTPGVRITFARPGGQPQMLYYFSTNLADDEVNKSGFLNWCGQLGQGRSLLKSASYLMHEGGFDTVRKFLLSHSATLFEDDSGIPVRWFEPARWSLRLFGAYPGPIAIFKKYDQPELAAMFRGDPPSSLPFGIGYRWRPRESTLIVAKPK